MSERIERLHLNAGNTRPSHAAASGSLTAGNGFEITKVGDVFTVVHVPRAGVAQSPFCVHVSAVAYWVPSKVQLPFFEKQVPGISFDAITADPELSAVEAQTFGQAAEAVAAEHCHCGKATGHRGAHRKAE